MESKELQQHFFNQIKLNLPAHLSLANELGELLNLSPDSVYRRIRGDKPVSLDELRLLCRHYHLSLDQVLQLKTDKVLFTDTDAGKGVNNFQEYLDNLLHLLQHFNSFRHRKVYYLSKDVPIFYFFYFEELAAFKSFFWSKSILNDPAFEAKKFSVAACKDSGYFETGQQILKEYNKIPSIELWNYGSIDSTILQAEYYRDAGIFESRADLDKVLDCCDAMLLHLQKQLEKSRKFMPGIGEAGYGADFEFYMNEIILGNNTILVETDETRTTFINHIVLKLISTTDPAFNDKAFRNFNNLLSRSSLISGTGEKERHKFFNAMRERIQACRK